MCIRDSIVTTVLTFPTIIGALFSYETSWYFIRIWLHFNLYTLRVICGLTQKTIGLENIPKAPFIVFSKHQSTWETIFLPSVLPNPIFVAKRELALIPGFGWCLYIADTILIRRGAGRSAIRQIEVQAKERFARGRCLVIFPEGTRRPPGAEPLYKIGCAVVATKTEVPVIPVAHNAGEFWPRHSFLKWPGEITVVFGSPVESQRKTPEELQEECVAWVEARQAEIHVPNRFPY